MIYKISKHKVTSSKARSFDISSLMTLLEGQFGPPSIIFSSSSIANSFRSSSSSIPVDPEDICDAFSSFSSLSTLSTSMLLLVVFWRVDDRELVLLPVSSSDVPIPSSVKCCSETFSLTWLWTSPAWWLKEDDPTMVDVDATVTGKYDYYDKWWLFKCYETVWDKIHNHTIKSIN